MSSHSYAQSRVCVVLALHGLVPERLLVSLGVSARRRHLAIYTISGSLCPTTAIGGTHKQTWVY